MVSKIWTVLRHNQTLVVTLILCVTLVGWHYGCAVATKSPFDPAIRLTRAELDIEVESWANKVTLAYSDISKQEQIRNEILNAGLAYAEGDGVSIVGLVTTLAGIAGLGAVIDNRRKDAVIVSKTNALKNRAENWGGKVT